MRRRHLRRGSWANIGVVALALVIITGSVILGLQSRHSKTKQSVKTTDDLGSHLKQVVLLVSSLRSVDGSSSTTIQNLNAVRNQLGVELTASNTLLKKTKNLTPDTRNKITASLNQIVALQSAYDQRLSSVLKPVAYDPEQDLMLDINTSSKDIATRAAAAEDGITAALKKVGFKLSDNSINGLSRSADCFGSLADDIRSGNIQNATTTRANCIKNYAQIRTYVVTDLLSALNDPDVQSSLDTLSSLAGQV